MLWPCCRRSSAQRWLATWWNGRRRHLLRKPRGSCAWAGRARRWVDRQIDSQLDSYNFLQVCPKIHTAYFFRYLWDRFADELPFWGIPCIWGQIQMWPAGRSLGLVVFRWGYKPNSSKLIGLSIARFNLSHCSGGAWSIFWGKLSGFDLRSLIWRRRTRGLGDDGPCLLHQDLGCTM